MIGLVDPPSWVSPAMKSSGCWSRICGRLTMLLQYRSTSAANFDRSGFYGRTRGPNRLLLCFRTGVRKQSARVCSQIPNRSPVSWASSTSGWISTFWRLFKRRGSGSWSLGPGLTVIRSLDDDSTDSLQLPMCNGWVASLPKILHFTSASLAWALRLTLTRDSTARAFHSRPLSTLQQEYLSFRRIYLLPAG